MRLAPTLALTALAAIAAAQNPTLVNAAGSPFAVGTAAFPVELPTSYNVPLALAPTGAVYLVLDPSLPTGYYAFDVVDVNFQPLSQLDASERIFFAANNGAAGFTITRVNNAPSLPAVGAGLGGVGQSMPVFPFDSPLPIAGRPDLTCVQKVWLSSLGPTGTSAPQFLGFHHFRVGNGAPGAVSGTVFEDLDHDGVRDAGEPGVAGVPVKLVSHNPANPGQVIASTLTNGSGQYLFSPVVIDDCSVVLEINAQQWVATTPTDVHLSNCGCGQQVVDFGKYTIACECHGHTIGYWRNCHGVSIIQNGQYWDELVALHLVNANGSAFNPTGNVSQWRNWLQSATAVNMAYMLSAQLAAMKLNVLSGGVSSNCWVSTCQGPMQIGAVITAADAALAQDGYTPNGDSHRALQTFLKNVLDAANNNLNWL